jgi:Flp pilus assembly protein TadD
MALDRPADAVPKLEAVVKGGSGSGFAYALLSMAYAQTGRASEAVDAATAAGARGGGDASVYLTAGRAMLVVERPAEAEKFFAEAVRLNPTDPESITRLGTVTAALGKRDEAAQLFRRALTLQPDYAPARHFLDELRPAPGPRRPD